MPFSHLMLKLSMFENDHTDFVIPIGLYSARLESLEKVLRRGSPVNPEIEAYYAAEDDSELQPYKGVVKDHSSNSDISSDVNLCSSGYGSLVVEWEDGTSDEMSPWEVNVCSSAASSQPKRPSLTSEEKKSVFEALAVIKGLPRVQAFLTPVDEMRYSDYASRIEVPMDLSFITARLETNYYATRFDVVANVKLIRENCAKYNGVNDDLSIAASEILDMFEGLVLGDEERQSYRDFEAAVVANIPQRDTNLQDADAPVESRATLRSARSQRQVHPRSSLEDLPAPQRVRIRMGRSERQQPPGRLGPAANLSSRSRRSTRSVLEMASTASTRQRAPGNRQPARAAVRQLSNQNEQLASPPRRGRSLGQANASNSSQQQRENVSGASLRSRTLRGATSVDNARRSQRGSSRAAVQSGSYADQPSEPEESERGGSLEHSGDDSDMSEGRQIGSSVPAQRSRNRSSRAPARAKLQDPDSEGEEDSEDSGGATGRAQRSPKRPSRAPARSKLQDRDSESEEDSEDGGGATGLAQRYRKRPSRASARSKLQDATGLAQRSRKRASRAPALADEDSEDSGGEKEESSGSDEELIVSDEDDSDASSEPKKRVSPRKRTGGHEDDSDASSEPKKRTSSPRRTGGRLSSVESPRRPPGRAGRQTYVDPSSSEFGSDVEEVIESKVAAGSRKRKAKTSKPTRRNGK
jgi:hypothetical protein